MTTPSDQKNIRSFFKRRNPVEKPVKDDKEEEEVPAKRRKNNNNDLHGANLDPMTYQRHLQVKEDDDTLPPPLNVIVNDDEETAPSFSTSKKIILTYQRDGETKDGFKINKSTCYSPIYKYRHQCKQCEMSYWQSSTLQQHIRTKHSDSRSFSCSDCDLTFKFKHELENHLAVHKDEKGVVCPHCDMAFKSQRLLIAHISNKHTDNDSKKYICPECGLGFGHKSDFGTHIRIHTEERPFVCEECGHSFTQKTQLNRHIGFLHGSPNNVDCKYCGKSMPKYDISRHETRHTREMDVTCTVCQFEPNEKADVSVRKEKYREHCLSIDHLIKWGSSSATTGYKPMPIEEGEQTVDIIRVLEYKEGQEGHFQRCANPSCHVRVGKHFCNAKVTYFHNVKHDISSYRVKEREKMTCNANNVIYLLTCLDPACENYGKMYIGQTIQELRDRINKHFGGGHGPKVAAFFHVCHNHLKIIPLLQTENIQAVLDIAETNFIKWFECRNTLKFGLNTLPGGQKGRDMAAAWLVKNNK